MADYFMPTVVQPSLPIADVTPLEALVLGHVFEFERDGEAVYFFAETGPSDQIEVPVPEVRAALEAASDVTSRTADLVRATLTEDMAGGDYLVLDLSETSWEFIFQDVIRRSASLDHVTIVSAQTCSRMRPDGFGGMAVVVTADFIKSKSTDDIVCELLDEAEQGPLDASGPDPAEGGRGPRLCPAAPLFGILSGRHRGLRHDGVRAEPGRRAGRRGRLQRAGPAARRRPLRGAGRPILRPGTVPAARPCARQRRDLVPAPRPGRPRPGQGR